MDCIICYNKIYYGIKYHNCHMKHLICHTCYLYTASTQCSLCRSEDNIYNTYILENEQYKLYSIYNHMPYNFFISYGLFCYHVNKSYVNLI